MNPPRFGLQPGDRGARGTYHARMRMPLAILIACLLGGGCARSPKPAEAAGAPVQVAERWPTAEEAAMWTISTDEALRIAREALEDQDPRHMIYHVDPVVRAGRQFWRVTGGSVIAGGWEAQIDARTGAVLDTRHFPGR